MIRGVHTWKDCFVSSGLWSFCFNTHGAFVSGHKDEQLFFFFFCRAWIPSWEIYFLSGSKVIRRLIRGHRYSHTTTNRQTNRKWKNGTFQAFKLLNKVALLLHRLFCRRAIMPKRIQEVMFCRIWWVTVEREITPEKTWNHKIKMAAGDQRDLHEQTSVSIENNESLCCQHTKKKYDTFIKESCALWSFVYHRIERVENTAGSNCL